MKEIWKDVVGYEGLYQVSNLGRVKSVCRIVEHKPYNLTIKERVLVNNTDKKGYYFVNLSKNGKVKCCRVHQLVGIAFMDNPENKIEINHINGIKTDNRIENLEWCSHYENMRHARKYGLVSDKDIKKMIICAKIKNSKKIAQIKDGNIIMIFDSGADAHRKLNFCANCISRVALGKQKSAYGYQWKFI